MWFTYTCLQSGDGYVFSQVCLSFSPGVFYVTITHDALNLTTQAPSQTWNLRCSQVCLSFSQDCPM